MSTALAKPLGGKAYGSIPHFAGSRRGPADKGVSEGQERIATVKARDWRDTIIVQVKLDGSNVAVAKVDGRVLALSRSGYEASTSKYEHHQLFAQYVRERHTLFDGLIADGEWISGEWLALAHGTRYDLAAREPFVAFDLWEKHNGKRRQAPLLRLRDRLEGHLRLVPTIHIGGPLSIEAAMVAVDRRLYGELDQPEGAVWRVERDGVVDYLAKYVRPNKVDGCYLPEVSGGEPVWQWRPAKGECA
jgi:ATP-dependent DNA ligase